MNLHASEGLEAILTRIWGPVVDLFESNVPESLLFLAGPQIPASFKLLDSVLPR